MTNTVAVRNSRQHTRFSVREAKGFTLLELLLVLCIIAIVTSFAMPSFSSMRDKQQHQADSEAIIDALQLARLTAVQEQIITTVCPGKPDTGCTKRWQDGVLVIADHASNPFQPEKLRFTLEPPSTLAWRGNIARLMFNEAGTLEGQAGSLILCSAGSNAKRAQRIIINRGGRTRIERHTKDDPLTPLCQRSWRY